jgi:hypothetical protein
VLNAGEPHHVVVQFTDRTAWREGHFNAHADPTDVGLKASFQS